MSTPFRLVLPRQIYNDLIAQARAELPNECCGLLAGRIEKNVGRVERRYPLVNLAASPVRYRNDSTELFAAFRSMRDQNLELLAIYHSHPTSEPVPSQVDLAMNNYGDSVVFLIISLQAEDPELGAWWLTGETCVPAEWELESP